MTIKINRKSYTEVKNARLGSFENEVRMIQRPFIGISKADYDTIMRETTFDVLVDKNGNQYTFGFIGSFYYLMPIKKEYYFEVA